jgi:hypothetical protein
MGDDRHEGGKLSRQATGVENAEDDLRLLFDGVTSAPPSSILVRGRGNARVVIQRRQRLTRAGCMTLSTSGRNPSMPNAKEIATPRTSVRELW